MVGLMRCVSLALVSCLVGLLRRALYRRAVVLELAWVLCLWVGLSTQMTVPASVGQTSCILDLGRFLW